MDHPIPTETLDYDSETDDDRAWQETAKHDVHTYDPTRRPDIQPLPGMNIQEDQSITAAAKVIDLDAYRDAPLPEPPPWSSDYYGETQKDEVPELKQLAEFLAGSKQPHFLVDGIIQRGRLHTLTALTAHGKTTEMVYFALCIGVETMGFAGRHTEHGRVVYFAGENPDDIAVKYQVACDYWGIDPATVPIDIVPGAFDLAGSMDPAIEKVAKGGDIAAVIVDTSAAYRFDPDEDDNQRSKIWGQLLRRLLNLPGNPTVIVPCHPTKGAAKGNLLPRGGGAFLNEVDSNLCTWSPDVQAANQTTELHWCGKHRGPSFAPINFDLIEHPHPTFKFRDGTPVPGKVAVPSDAPAPKATPDKPRRDIKPEVAHMRDCFHNLLVTHGQPILPEPGMPTVTGIDRRTTFRPALVAAGWFDESQLSEDGKPTDSGYSAEKNSLRALKSLGILSFNRDFVWQI
jgi:hypothetical protein